MTFEHTFSRREHLLAAALHEFSAHGYAQASLNRILAAAGMSKGQLYHHFGSKEGLYLALVAELVRQRRAHPVPLHADLFAALRAQVLAARAFAAAHPALHRFAEALQRERGRPIHDRAAAAHRLDDVDGVRGLVAWAHARGDLCEGLSLEAAQRIVSACMDNIAALAALEAPGDVEARVDEVVAFLRRGLAR